MVLAMLKRSRRRWWYVNASSALLLPSLPGCDWVGRASPAAGKNDSATAAPS